MGIFKDIIEGNSSQSQGGLFSPPEEEVVPKKPGFINDFGDAAKNTSMGFVQGALSTGVKTGTAIESVLDKTLGRGINLLKGKGFTPTNTAETARAFNAENPLFTTPQNGWQQLGFTGEKIAEFLAPSSKINKGADIVGGIAKNLAPTVLKGFANLSGKATVQGLTSGGITALQTGMVGSEAKINALVGAAFPFAAAALGKAGEAIMTKSIKPSVSDVRNGYKSSTISEFGLGGTIDSSLSKTETRLQNYATELNRKIEGYDATINVQALVDKTVVKLWNKNSIVKGVLTNTKDGIVDLKNNIDEVLGAFKEHAGMDFASNAMPIKYAQDLKQGAGTRGAWAYGLPDRTKAGSIERVWTEFYGLLKTEIETVTEATGITGVKAINASIHKLIPVQSALIKAAARIEKNNVFSLGDIIFLAGSVFDPRALMLYGANYASKSPGLMNMLYNASESAIAPATKGIVSSTAPQ